MAEWTNSDVVEWFDLNGMDAETQAAIIDLLKSVADSMPTSFADSIRGSGLGDAARDATSDELDAISDTPFEKDAYVNVTPHVNVASTYAAASGALSSSSAVSSSYSYTSPVTGKTVTPYAAGNHSISIGGHASGGMVNGRELSWVGEEGPEMIIPLVPSRRERAIELYQKAGEMLGVTAHAHGGIVGAVASSETTYSNSPMYFSRAENDTSYRQSVENSIVGAALSELRSTAYSGGDTTNTMIQRLLSNYNAESNVNVFADKAFSNSVTSYNMPIDEALSYFVQTKKIAPSSHHMLLSEIFNSSNAFARYVDAHRSISAHASGGIVNNEELSWVGEEGPEMIIPLVPSRRERAVELYRQAGEILGITAHANGGLVGIGSSSSLSSYNELSSETLNYLTQNANEAPISSPAFSEDYSSPLTNSNTQNIFSNNQQTAVQPNVTVKVEVKPEFNITGNDQSDDEIMAVIRRHMGDVTDELCGKIANKLEEVFSNMPLKGVSV